MVESIFENWLWWFLIAFLFVWWWPKKIRATTFTAQAHINIERINVETAANTQPTDLPKFSLVSRNWGFITSVKDESIFTLEENGDYVIQTGCHQAEDLNQPNNLDNQFCNLLTGQMYAIPHSKKLFVSRNSKYIALIPESKLPQPSELLITEVMWMGSYDQETSLARDEWIELFNNSEHTLDLEGVQLVNAGVAGQTIIIPADYLLPPFTFFIIGASSVENSQLARNPDWVNSQLSLSNSDSSLQLLSSASEVLDTLPGGKWQAGVNDTTQHLRLSAQRTFFEEPGSSWNSWTNCQPNTCLFLNLHNWKTQDPPHNFGTPWEASVF